MDIKRKRPSRAVQASEPAARQTKGVQPEIPAPRHGDPPRSDSYGCQGELPERAGGTRSPVQSRFSSWNAVTIVMRGKDAGVNRESFFHQDVEGPQRLSSD